MKQFKINFAKGAHFYAIKQENIHLAWPSIHTAQSCPHFRAFHSQFVRRPRTLQQVLVPHFYSHFAADANSDETEKPFAPVCSNTLPSYGPGPKTAVSAWLSPIFPHFFHRSSLGQW
ncbi:hypothetical protein BpHYR1_004074 [Brachionus plicatilis]|uniref:Uncharacterized protein n=1 Tax=Brachionus plicatilis TaxID=10195 RepID=A0A3M7PSE6_BRAPC|nr:hypothetical protein BpHYR1_004074 [Brachionus plicatilis]